MERLERVKQIAQMLAILPKVGQTVLLMRGNGDADILMINQIYVAGDEVLFYVWDTYQVWDAYEEHSSFSQIKYKDGKWYGGSKGNYIGEIAVYWNLDQYLPRNPMKPT